MRAVKTSGDCSHWWDSSDLCAKRSLGGPGPSREAPKEYFSVIKKNEVLIHVVALMNLEDVVLSEKSPSQKTDITSFI